MSGHGGCGNPAPTERPRSAGNSTYNTHPKEFAMPCRSSPNLIFWTVAQTGKVTPLVSGPPGCGKSRTVEAFARAMHRQCYTLIGSLREPADVGG
jgi:hypothetical protein